ncbi:MAG: hypothetical protein NZ938_03700 [Aigarchaeota archaeon]|nr:hypothetical protein [Candidatus Calditenuaceae archaeon]
MTEEGYVLPRRKVPEGVPYLYVYMLGRAVAGVLGLVEDSTFSLGRNNHSDRLER